MAALSMGFSGAGQAGDWNTLGGAQWTPVAAFEARDGGGSPAQESTAPSRTRAPALVRLRALVSAVESHRDGYDAYHLSAPVPPPAPPSRMIGGKG